uniref:Uncharacterized protein n=1 Tax=Meloidogyne incognita TaxID=6306 RepID=A0A914LTP3_MELIC
MMLDYILGIIKSWFLVLFEYWFVFLLKTQAVNFLQKFINLLPICGHFVTTILQMNKIIITIKNLFGNCYSKYLIILSNILMIGFCLYPMMLSMMNFLLLNG